MKDISKLKRLLESIAVYENYFLHRQCLLEDIVRDNNCAPCGDCKYSCFNRCTAVGVSVLR